VPRRFTEIHLARLMLSIFARHGIVPGE